MSVKLQEVLLEVTDNHSREDDVDSSEIEITYENLAFTGVVDDFDNDIYDMDLLRFNTREDLNKYKVGTVYYDYSFKNYLVKDFDSPIRYTFDELYFIEIIGCNQ